MEMIIVMFLLIGVLTCINVISIGLSLNKKLAGIITMITFTILNYVLVILTLLNVIDLSAIDGYHDFKLIIVAFCLILNVVNFVSVVVIMIRNNNNEQQTINEIKDELFKYIDSAIRKGNKSKALKANNQIETTSDFYGFVDDDTDSKNSIMSFGSGTKKEEQKQIVEEEIPTKPNWDELSDADKKPYLESAIKILYENQLKDEKSNLTRTQIALKKQCITNGEFFLEDLNKQEKNEVNKQAQELYENHDNFDLNDARDNTSKPKKKWEDLSEDKQKEYIEIMIQALYEEQLSSGISKLTRAQIALKKNCLDNNEFLFDDLNKKEKEMVLKLAKEFVENENDCEDNYEYNNNQYQEYKKKERKYLWSETIKYSCYSIAVAGIVNLFGTWWIGLILSAFFIPAILLSVKNKSRLKEYELATKLSQNSIKQNSDYKHSPRHFIGIAALMFGIICVVLIGLNLALSLMIGSDGGNDTTATISMIMFPIAFMFGFYSFILTMSRKGYCTHCGHLGHLENEELVDSKLSIERVPTLEGSRIGHITYDKNGKIYSEQLVETKVYCHTYKCSICGNVWEQNRTIKSR